MTTASTTADEISPATPTDADQLDLDIRFLEFSDSAADLINLTDNGCGSSCPSACATSIG